VRAKARPRIDHPAARPPESCTLNGPPFLSPLSGVTHYGYNANSDLTSVEDSDSNTTTYAYDHLDRKTSETDANSNTASFTYDLAGELTSQTDKDGRVTNFSYDHDGRLTQEQWMSSGTAIYTATWAYEAAGLFDQRDRHLFRVRLHL
jgi:YD repeat-containing protein